MSDSTRSRRWSLRETISLLSSVYSVVLLVGLLASLIIQIQPILVLPIGVEVGKYSMVFFTSVLISYIVFKRTIRKENSELCEYLTSLNKTLIYDMRISQYLISMAINIADEEAKPEAFEYVIKQIKKKEEEVQKIKSASEKYPTLYTLPSEGAVGAIIGISSIMQIPFQELASFLCSKLGKEHAKRLVKKEKILKCYGNEEVSMWKSIIE